MVLSPRLLLLELGRCVQVFRQPGFFKILPGFIMLSSTCQGPRPIIEFVPGPSSQGSPKFCRCPEPCPL